MSVNPMLQVDQYPLPNPNELMASLANGKFLTKLDLTSAYQQMLLDEDSAELVTINTHQGLYEYSSLPFGIASAPAVFQRAMDTILQGIPHVVCYLDDILVTGESEDQHLQHLEELSVATTAWRTVYDYTPEQVLVFPAISGVFRPLHQLGRSAYFRLQGQKPLLKHQHPGM